MNNVIFCEFLEADLELLKINDNENNKFPIIKISDSIDEASKHDGFMVIIKSEIKEKKLKYFFKLYHHKFKNYKHILLYNEDYALDLKIKRYNKVLLVNNYLFSNDFSFYLDELYYNTVCVEKTFNANKQTKLDTLIAWLNDKKNFKTSDIVHELGITKRSVERYLESLYDLGYKIYYDTKTKSWYYIKGN